MTLRPERALDSFSAKYLGDVAGSGEAEGDGTDGLGHEAHGDLIAAIPHGLDGLRDVAVVVRHAYVLSRRGNAHSSLLAVSH